MNEETILALTAGSILVTKLTKVQESLKDVACEAMTISGSLGKLPEDIKTRLEGAVSELESAVKWAKRNKEQHNGTAKTWKNLMSYWEIFQSENPELDKESAKTFEKSLKSIFGKMIRTIEDNAPRAESILKGVTEELKQLDDLDSSIETIASNLGEKEDEMSGIADELAIVASHLPLPPLEYETFNIAIERIYGKDMVDEARFMQRLRGDN